MFSPNFEFEKNIYLFEQKMLSNFPHPYLYVFDQFMTEIKEFNINLTYFLAKILFLQKTINFLLYFCLGFKLKLKVIDI